MPCGDLPIQDKVVVVTGGGSGINFAFVQLVLKDGARGIIIADLRLGKEAQDLVNKEQKAVFSQCDVTKRKDLEGLIKTSVEKFGDVPDVYVAGAGVFEPAWSNWWDDTEDDKYAELDINVTHALKLSRIATRALVSKKKKGAILIVSSLAGYQGTFGAPLYCASKHAVIGFVRSVAQLDDLENIKVVAVAPGLVHTPLWTDRPDVMQAFGYDEKAAVTPEFVAEKMLELIIKGEYKGGSCLEVSASTVRTLGTWDIPAPKAFGTAVPVEALEATLAPLRKKIDKDREWTV